ncbi:MAG: iron-containing redox enzyme family protein [Alphaproteobacteria bacterium]
MATAIDLESIRDSFYAEVRERANAQFESESYRRILALPLTTDRARKYVLQKGFWNLNRRDCWAFAQALAPMDVKALIWDHELDELQGNEARGVEDHYSLQIRQAATIGLTRDDFENEEPADETLTCVYAWIHLCRDSPWLKSVAACAALEVSNSADWVTGGGMSYRWAKKQEAELGIPYDKQVNAKEHAEVDIEHGNLLAKVATAHCDTPEKFNLMLEGLRESWALDRAWKGCLANMMAALPDPE